jgi:hypothetical protein
MIDLRMVGNTCTILGSAPDTVLPSSNDVIVAANGGVQIARDHGLGVEVLCTTAHLCRKRGHLTHEKKSLDSWKEFSISSVWVDTKDGPIVR